MQLGENLMNKYDNYKLLHLVRDPRGVTQARVAERSPLPLEEINVIPGNQSSGTGWTGTDEDLSITARDYCLQATEDMIKQRHLQVSHPGKSTRVVHDLLVTNFAFHSRDIYKFLGLKKSILLLQTYHEIIIISIINKK